MMKLSALLANIASLNSDVDITGLALDSRAVQAGNVFIALAGANHHGLSHAEQAIANGAVAVLYDPHLTVHTELIAGYVFESFTAHLQDKHAHLDDLIAHIAIENLSAKLGSIAARFYDNPSQHLNVIGITGTNGKTSCSQFLAQLLDDCGIIGTLGWGSWGELQKTLNTTPDALSVQTILASLRENGKRSVAMEVSSHGLAQGRVNGVRFMGAVFTNITRDHLDYHGTMAAYLNAKLTLLNTPELAFAVVNLNDSYSQQVIAAVPESVALWTINTDNNVSHAPNRTSEHIHAKQISYSMNGISFTVCWRDEQQLISVPLYGSFNTENILCVLAVMLALGMTLNESANRLARLQAVTGRMECFGGGDLPLVFVDYAHTPDALEKVLYSARQHCTANLSVVFGCGGNRDTGKRPEMGRIAEQLADKVIITNDNPRFEAAADIIKDILSGCQQHHLVISDRLLAIQTALMQARGGDCVIIAGKGHEDYQEQNGEKKPFSDREVVINALRDKL